MATTWVIEIRLGERPDAAPLRRAVVDARSEAEALRLVLGQAEADEARTRAGLDDGQEEVFSQAEAAKGRPEHHSGENDTGRA
ncbi:hypothetical protein [Phenylobacterium sp.]|uniref:hypothetical protein n=1 Tax=Phenylobacterium sp. TaxID=1871053 RepID=UPI00272F7578|nr:hypothetical protein [Phenylobacterium sp.]MDP1618706.1 hypothetical protein [Phenylobacterium sp.]MDP1986036.1 hypothetical protein [Phenylobacterium sp.]